MERLQKRPALQGRPLGGALTSHWGLLHWEPNAHARDPKHSENLKQKGPSNTILIYASISQPLLAIQPPVTPTSPQGNSEQVSTV